jgi:signal peptidase I
MPSTILIWAIFLILTALQATLWGVFFWFGARWARLERVTWPRVAFVAFTVGVLQTILAIVILAMRSQPPGWAAVLAILSVVVPCDVIQRLFRARLGQAIRAWLPTLLTHVVVVAVVALVVNPFIAQAFTSPSNAMAPTLLGPHWEAPCPRCGATAYCTPDRSLGEPWSNPRGQLMICSQELQACEVGQCDTTVHEADRFVVSKLTTPRRWDVVVFRYPEEPTTRYLFRLVGLPGEEVRIRDGAVWIDGRRLEMPESLRGLRYETPEGIPFDHVWGVTDPAQLGPDEYFVLGDFSRSAKDSRLWQSPAPGHAPYAVPKSYIEGVVTQIYWPTKRWRVFR